ncbi:hypothetical protein FGU65_13475 [Methanoculleus sp. FWC-SCC1]|uniref:Uncharacterized protein n=1 Tax=Methanoculleus frigidifontis TaxID=2584085 RepID=A0ABT8MD54_9EURY|nr:hypothetical protein [Methanoculleus sp. FWC-SCC1]MDN7025879.1 hypothetical protein [Methanoculleus sp. FWC-SCC1]
MGTWLKRIALGLLALALAAVLLGLLYLYPGVVLAYEIGLIGLVFALELLGSTSFRQHQSVQYLRATLAAGLVIFGIIVVNKLLVILGT